MDATVFHSAVEALHSPHAAPAQRAAANAWLVEFAANEGAPALCESVLRAPEAPEPTLIFAAGVVASSASRLGAAAAVPLLQLCAGVASRPAAARLAQAATAVVVVARAEDALLTEATFVSLDVARKMLVLQSLAEALEQQASPEELQYRPSARAACAAAVQLLQPAALPPAPPASAAPALRCLASWAACGLGYAQLCEEYAPLAAALAAALPAALAPCDDELQRSELLSHATRALAVLRACVQASVDTGEELELLPTCAPLLRTLGGFRGAVPLLGVPTVDAATGESDGGGTHGDACAELASGLAALGALLLDLLAEPIVEALDAGAVLVAGAGGGGAVGAMGGEAAGVVSVVAAAAAGCEGGGEEGELIAALLSFLLACSSHPVAAVAEAAADGWRDFVSALPSAPAGGGGGGGGGEWRGALLSRVVGATLPRLSRAQLRRGCGDDDDDLADFRERSGAPLLAALSEGLGETRWLAPLAGVLRTTLPGAGAGGGADGGGGALPLEQLEQIEVALFAGACTSARCCGAGAGGPGGGPGGGGGGGGLLQEVQQLAARFEEAGRQAQASSPLAAHVAESAVACREALWRAELGED